ncbi:ATP-dependent Clp protease ATP-binding subunit clpX-like [Penicillium chermesinum]|nr:ATP-dependent Clp protease ATP-binding subunit clpX-like [Penicillium chermesinum]
MAKTLARVLSVPFSISDCTPFTQAGYIGEDVESCVHRLLAAANYDVEQAERGIIVLDEIDKIASAKVQAKSEKNPRTTSPPNTYPSNSPLGNSPFQPNGGPPSGKGETYNVRTDNILFIFSGAFVGLHKVVMDRISRGSIGFGQPIRSASRLDHGFDPSNASSADEASQSSRPLLLRILTEPRNSLIAQYATLFSLSGVELRFTTPALHKIAANAFKMGTGARALRTEMETILSDAMYEVPGSSVKFVLVTEAVANRDEKPVYLARGQGGKFHAMISAEESQWEDKTRREKQDKNKRMAANSDSSETAEASNFKEYRKRAAG